MDDPSCLPIVLVADGAHGIWEQNAKHLRAAGKTWIEILDFYHASQHIWAVWPLDDTAQHKTWCNDSAMTVESANHSIEVL